LQRTYWIFLCGIVIPSLLLAWIAFRSIEQQQFVVENQAAALYQSETDLLAEEINLLLQEVEADFQQTVDQLAAELPPNELGPALDRALERQLPGAIGFLLSPSDKLEAPALSQAANAPDVADFLANRVTSEVFVQKRVPAPAPVMEEKAAEQEGGVRARSLSDAAPSGSANRRSSKLAYENVQELRQQKVAPAAPKAQVERDEFAGEEEQAEEVPAVQADEATAPLPSPDLIAFRNAVGNSPSGLLTRLTDDGSQIFLWQRPARHSDYVVGCMLAPETITALLADALPRDEGRVSDYVLAVLNARAVPVWTSRDDPDADWQYPFVSTPIGKTLPMWEAALLLVDPGWLARNARTARITIALMGSAAIGTILLAGFLVIAAARRRMELAERKSDFVSSVSHELKTPLTSIRMFGELLQQPTLPEEKRLQFSGIITTECERLTRLVANVLSFSRLERNRIEIHPQAIDLRGRLQDLADRHESRLREAGLKLTTHLPDQAVPIEADPDALEQIVLNLLQNAEKYAAEGGSIDLQLRIGRNEVEIIVADRGPGVPRGREKRIFQAFERSVDTLTSGKPGAGLGLAICAGLVRAHQGRIGYRTREGGGAEFWFTLPVDAE